VTNNPDKFPAGYFVELSKPEKSELVENFHRFNKLKHSTVNPKAFPEKGLYMLATNHPQKSAGSSGYPGDHRDFLKNQTAIKKHSGAIACSR
jgi:hypothetical protein